MSEENPPAATTPQHRGQVRAHEHAVEVIADGLREAGWEASVYDTARAVLAVLFACPDVLRELASAATPAPLDTTPDIDDREELVDLLDMHMRLDDRGDAERVADALIGHPVLLHRLSFRAVAAGEGAPAEPSSLADRFAERLDGTVEGSLLGYFGLHRVAQMLAEVAAPGADTATPDDRCPSCDHLREFHSEPGCWHGVTVGAPGKPINCPCGLAGWS